MTGKLKLDGKLAPLRAERTFESWLSTLYAKKWVAFAQGPPSGVEGAEAVLKYLARYVSGVAISDRRLVSHANGQVRFRWKNYARGGCSVITPPLEGLEFVRRYLLHVLPRGFVRIRGYGLPEQFTAAALAPAWYGPPALHTYCPSAEVRDGTSEASSASI